MNGGRVNQKARTRAAILDAAVDLLRDGRPVTVPAAAERARVSPATAYRYFASTEDLADEAALELIDVIASTEVVTAAIDAAGNDVHDRLEALIRTLGRKMLTEQMPFRQAAKAGLDRWFAQQQDAPENRKPVRVGRRDAFTRQALEPVRRSMKKADYERLVASLNVGWGTEAMISLIDIDQLAAEAALEVMHITCRWILDGALAEARQR
jgi:AcrR family transcriptional regulator